MLREVTSDAESSEGLAQQAPALQTQGPTQVLTILDDLVGAQVGEQPGGGRARAGNVRAIHRAGGAGATLVDEDEPIVLQDRTDPAQAGIGTGPGRLAARPALEEDQWRPGERVDDRG